MQKERFSFLFNKGALYKVSTKAIQGLYFLVFCAFSNRMQLNDAMHWTVGILCCSTARFSFLCWAQELGEVEGGPAL